MNYRLNDVYSFDEKNITIYSDFINSRRIKILHDKFVNPLIKHVQCLV